MVGNESLRSIWGRAFNSRTILLKYEWFERWVWEDWWISFIEWPALVEEDKETNLLIGKLGSGQCKFLTRRGYLGACMCTSMETDEEKSALIYSQNENYLECIWFPCTVFTLKDWYLLGSGVSIPVNSKSVWASPMRGIEVFLTWVGNDGENDRLIRPRFW